VVRDNGGCDDDGVMRMVVCGVGEGGHEVVVVVRACVVVGGGCAAVVGGVEVARGGGDQIDRLVGRLLGLGPKTRRKSFPAAAATVVLAGIRPVVVPGKARDQLGNPHCPRTNSTARLIPKEAQMKLRANITFADACSEYGEQDIGESCKSLQNQGDVNEAMGHKKKAVVVTSDPLALVAEKTKVNKRKEKVTNTNNNLRTSSASSSANKKPEETNAWMESSSRFRSEIMQIGSSWLKWKMFSDSEKYAHHLAEETIS
ncbi:hypothetical protein Tco_0478143, partial [Tanacetum coccineum]